MPRCNAVSESVGRTILGKIAKSTGVGILFGVVVATGIDAKGIDWLWCMLSTAAAAFLGGCILAWVDWRSQRIAASKSKAMPLWLVLLLMVALPVAIAAAFVAMYSM